MRFTSGEDTLHIIAPYCFVIETATVFIIETSSEATKVSISRLQNGFFIPRPGVRSPRQRSRVHWCQYQSDWSLKTEHLVSMRGVLLRHAKLLRLNTELGACQCRYFASGPEVSDESFSVKLHPFKVSLLQFLLALEKLRIFAFNLMCSCASLVWDSSWVILLYMPIQLCSDCDRVGLDPNLQFPCQALM